MKGAAEQCGFAKCFLAAQGRPAMLAWWAGWYPGAWWAPLTRGPGPSSRPRRWTWAWGVLMGVETEAGGGSVMHSRVWLGADT